MSSVNPETRSDRSDHLTATETAMADLWREVLQTNHVIAPGDDFFALGGDSMAMVTLEFRVNEALAVCLPAGAVLGAPTLQQLSQVVDSLRAHAAPL
jgi:acyl carrier protein